MLENAEFVIGNSSVGVREAPVFGIPSINIGDRQHNRHRSEAIIDVNPTKKDIECAINALPVVKNTSFSFGEGGSSRLFIAELSKDKTWAKNRLKQFIDIDLLKQDLD